MRKGRTLKYSIRNVQYMVEFLKDNEGASTREIVTWLNNRTRRSPTTHETSNILSKTRFFDDCGSVRIHNAIGTSYINKTWKLNWEECIKEGLVKADEQM